MAKSLFPIQILINSFSCSNISLNNILTKVGMVAYFELLFLFLENKFHETSRIILFMKQKVTWWIVAKGLLKTMRFTLTIVKYRLCPPIIAFQVPFLAVICVFVPSYSSSPINWRIAWQVTIYQLILQPHWDDLAWFEDLNFFFRDMQFSQLSSWFYSFRLAPDLVPFRNS